MRIIGGTLHYLEPTDILLQLLLESVLAMGRKKIQITRIVDERNRQVRVLLPLSYNTALKPLGKDLLCTNTTALTVAYRTSPLYSVSQHAS